MQQTIYWHDYESTGLNTRRDRPTQFAGVRTDLDLNIIDTPLMMYCKPAMDVLPEPIAAMVTGITPQLCEQKGLPEHGFAKLIEAQLAAPGTIGVGYNTISYDDEITRFMFWRNLHDPYAREWQNECGRWDIIEMVRAAYALRSEGIVWPTNSDGRPSFKLEDLSKANGLVHEAAHDALSDVYATIALAKLIKEKNPKLYDYAFSMHKKDRALDVLNAASTPFVHISRGYGAARGFIAPVMPIQVHPTNKNEFVCWDLTMDPSDLSVLDAKAINERLYVRREDVGVERLGIVKIAANKSPMIMKTLGLLKDGTAEKWGIDLHRVHENMLKLQDIMKQRNLAPVFDEVYKKEYNLSVVPDEDLYGGFVGRIDRGILNGLCKDSESDIAAANPRFSDDRLKSIFFNFKARNFPHILNANENDQWLSLIKSRLIDGVDGFKTIETYTSEIDALLVANADNPHRVDVLNSLKQYGEELKATVLSTQSSLRFKSTLR